MQRRCASSSHRHRRTRRLPTIRFRPSLFWDIDPRTLDPDKHARYIIARMLDFGNDREVRWMWHRYPKRTIRSVVERSRGLHPQTRALWSLLTATEHPHR